MQDRLLIHPKTRQSFQSYLEKPSQSLIIYGLAGSGKYTLAINLAAELLHIPADKLSNYPYFYLIDRSDNKQEISIESIRELIKKINLKPVIAESGKARAAVLIKDAHHMSHEAQNALLKIIEEPPVSTVFIMTVNVITNLLPTIASRAQKISISPIRLTDAAKFFAERYPYKQIQSAWSLSDGAAELMEALLEDDNQHYLKRSVDEAKKLLRMSKYDRLIFLDSLSGNKEEVLMLLDALNRILSALHRSAVQSGSAQANKILFGRKLITSTIDQVNTNTSSRLALLNLALNLSV